MDEREKIFNNFQKKAGQRPQKSRIVTPGPQQQQQPRREDPLLFDDLDIIRVYYTGNLSLCKFYTSDGKKEVPSDSKECVNSNYIYVKNLIGAFMAGSQVFHVANQVERTDEEIKNKVERTDKILQTIKAECIVSFEYTWKKVNDDSEEEKIKEINLIVKT